MVATVLSMSYVKNIAVAVVLLLVPAIFIWERQSYAQGRPLRETERRFDEEDLAPDSQTVTPDDESAIDDTEAESHESSREAEEEFPRRDSRTAPDVPSVDGSTPLSVDPNAAPHEEIPEEPPVVTSGPPALPAASALLPRDQVALSFVALGIASIDKDDLVQARRHFERALEVAPLQPYSYFFLGRLALTRGEHQKALPLLRKADILLTRGDQAWRSEAMSAQGAVYEDLGELPQARRAYRQSLRFFPQNLRAMSALARLAGEEPDSDDPVSQ